MRALRLPFIVGAVLFAAVSNAQLATETIEVIGTTPLDASLDPDKIASNVQLAVADEIREQGGASLAEFMNRSFGSVVVNDAQNNPLQPDVQYRGYVGSPLLGLPQGIAVYQDSVRVNEPFGDTVNWALIPDSAMDTVFLIPGSNPLYGLNALGGAISIRTKNGFTSPGTSAEVFGGSFSRTGVEIETGGSFDDRLSYFVTVSYLEENGWRDYSPTEATQLFANVGWQSEASSIDFSVTRVATDLIGSGAAPVQLLELSRKAVFTRPDRTENALTLLNLIGTRNISDSLVLTGNGYLRHSDITTYNGDDSNYRECVNTPGFICEADQAQEEITLDQDMNPIAVGDGLIGATVNRSVTEQASVGFGIQAAWNGELGGRKNSATVGLAYDEGSTEFRASTELGALDVTRLASPGEVIVGDASTRLNAEISNTGTYVSNVFSLSDAISLSVSGRYNKTEVTLRDRLGTALNGDHSFGRLNPAIGLVVNASDKLDLYAGYAESSRAPSPVELTCADQDDPCRLPNAFLADPPLKEVVAKTIEAGVRGRWNSGTWHAGLFRALNRDDILFISAGALTNEGYFANVGKTRREGVELNFDGDAGSRVTWYANYTYLNATFEEAFLVASPNNPQAVNGEVEVRPGNHLPLVPGQVLKAGFRFGPAPKLVLAANVLATSDAYYRGDEGNLVDPFDGYTTLNLRGEYAVSDSVELFLNFENILNVEYETFGLFGEADEVLGDDFDDKRFLSPGQPRAAWFGVRVQF
jgi:outer membrane receptor protein involved in Fe transport